MQTFIPLSNKSNLSSNRCCSLSTLIYLGSIAMCRGDALVREAKEHILFS